MLGPGPQPSVQQGLTGTISMEPLRVRTFGGLTLLVGGEPTTRTLTQRRRLALLALLAVARNRGLSRDKILAYLWPESDAERARHGLDQVLYAQRNHLGVPDLFLGRKTLRLNRTVITAEVNPFDTETAVRSVEAWVAAGDRAAALRTAVQHVERLRSDLGLELDSRVVRLLEQLKTGTAG